MELCRSDEHAISGITVHFLLEPSALDKNWPIEWKIEDSRSTLRLLQPDCWIERENKLSYGRLHCDLPERNVAYIEELGRGSFSQERDRAGSHACGVSIQQPHPYMRIEEQSPVRLPPVGGFPHTPSAHVDSR